LEAGGVIETWSGMPDEPRLVRRIERHGRVDALAVTDDGAVVAVAGGGVVQIDESGGWGVVAEGGRVSALAFARHSRDLAIADLDRNQVLVVGAGAVARDFERPSSVAFSADGRKLAVASAERSAVALIDLASGQTQTLAGECGVETLARARGNAVFRLTESAKGRAPLLDGDGAEPRIVFVAAGEESQ
jgi:DNA-binding beta-propeller fold protein YncE